MTYGVPTLTADDVKKHVSDAYNVEVTTVTKMDSYIDQNWKIESPSGNMVFKVANKSESEQQLRAEETVMAALQRDAEFSKVFPNVIPTKNNETMVRCQGYLTRCIPMLSGKVIANSHPISDQLLNQLGQVTAAIDVNLQHLEIPACHRFLRWDLKCAHHLNDVAELVLEGEEKELTKFFMSKFEELLPMLQSTPMQVIHNDVNDYNVLSDGNQITAVLDFGDIVHTHRICELAIALAYMLMGRCESEDQILQVLTSFVSGYCSRLPLTQEELQILWYLIAARLCTSVTISSIEAKKNPDNIKYIEISAKGAWELLRAMKKADGEKMVSEIMKIGANFVKEEAIKKYTNEEILQFREKHCPKTLSIQFKSSGPLKISRGSGCYLYTESGDRYLDCVNNVCHVGHCHPRLVSVAHKQMKLLNTNTRFLSDNLVAYMDLLLKTFPKELNLDCVFLVNSGTEANELALRLARTATKRRHSVVVDHAYHGHSNSLLDISPYKFRDQGHKVYTPDNMPKEVSWVPMPDVYRGQFKTAEEYANALREEMERLKSIGVQPAAFWAESLMGVGGQVIPPDNWLSMCHKIAREYGAVCIADEVQVGFGRVGTHYWAFQCQGGDVSPDIITLGKPIGNGHPMAAVVTTRAIADAFADTGIEYFATFGGNPVSCAIGTELLHILKDEKLMENALETGNYFQSKLRELQPKHPVIVDVRGKGLFIGAELMKDGLPWSAAPTVSEGMKKKGIIITTDGPDNNVLKIKPPIVFDKKCVDTFCSSLNQVLTEMGV